MKNTDTEFYGQQTNEQILHVIRPHDIAINIQLIKVYLVSLAVFASFLLISQQFVAFKSIISMSGAILAVIIAIGGTLVVKISQKKNISYVTDRRIVRFDPTNPFATNIRSLAWDEVIKIKSFPLNFIFKMLKIGTIIVHARTSIRTEDENAPNPVTADDIEFNNVYYYRDLGNYIDKILFTYKKRPQEISQIKPFVTKPKGKRY